MRLKERARAAEGEWEVGSTAGERACAPAPTLA